MLNIKIIYKFYNPQICLNRTNFGGFGVCLPYAKSFQTETDPEINSGRPRFIIFGLNPPSADKFVHFVKKLSTAMKCKLLVLAV
jgi:hypothetical protein